MKRYLILTAILSTKLFASTFVLPTTMDAGSVQAKLKGLLFAKLEAEGPITGDYQANLTGDYGQVTLEDASSKIVCSEFSAGMLAVQQFECVVTLKDGSNQEYASLLLPLTMDSASTQSVVKEVLFNELQANGPVTSPYEANLTGSYRKVMLKDQNNEVICSEQSAGMLAVQQFACEFAAVK